MDKKILRDFPDGSQMMQLEDGRIAFVVDPEQFAFNRWADSPMLAHMIRSHANEARLKTHIRKGFRRIVEQYQGAFFLKTDSNMAMRQIQAELSHFMQALVHSRDVRDFLIDVGSTGHGRLRYQLQNINEFIDLTFEVQDVGRALDKAIEQRSHWPKSDAGERTLVEKLDPERLKHLAGIKPKRFEDVKADLIDYAKKVLPNVPVQGVTESLISHAAKEIASEMDRQILDELTRNTYPVLSPMPQFKNPIKQLSAKEICETQPMCTQPATGAVAEAVNSIDFQYVPKRAVYKIDVGAIEPEKISEKIAEIKEAFNKHTHPTGVGPTQPPVMDLRMQRKKDGLCPECGDIKRESAVGVCRDHGKFMG